MSGRHYPRCPSKARSAKHLPCVPWQSAKAICHGGHQANHEEHKPSKLGAVRHILLPYPSYGPAKILRVGAGKMQFFKTIRPKQGSSLQLIMNTLNRVWKWLVQHENYTFLITDLVQQPGYTILDQLRFLNSLQQEPHMEPLTKFEVGGFPKSKQYQPSCWWLSWLQHEAGEFNISWGKSLIFLLGGILSRMGECLRGLFIALATLVGGFWKL